MQKQFDILGLMSKDPMPSETDIEKAFDVAIRSSDVESKKKRIKKAFAILTNESQRRQYSQVLRDRELWSVFNPLDGARQPVRLEHNGNWGYRPYRATASSQNQQLASSSSTKTTAPAAKRRKR